MYSTRFSTCQTWKYIINLVSTCSFLGKTCAVCSRLKKIESAQLNSKYTLNGKYVLYVQNLNVILKIHVFYLLNFSR